MPRTALCCCVSLGVACGPTIGEVPSPTATPSPTEPPFSCDPWTFGAPPPVPALEDPWWQSAIVYEIFVRSFRDTDGDGIGDFEGVRQGLDYVQSLGATAVWLMPPLEATSVHGYDVTRYDAVEPDYGSEADFAALVEELHARGMYLIMDLPLNHSASAHPWFQQALEEGAARRGWYHFSDAPQGESGWHPAPSGGGYYYGHFSPGMPDLNWGEADLRQEMLGVMEGWMWAGVDAFRLDAARHLIEEGEVIQDHPGTFCLLTGLRRSLAQLRPDVLLIGEIWSGTPDIAPYLDDGESDLLPLAFDFPVAEGLVNGLLKADPAALVGPLDSRKQIYPAEEMGMPFLTNHDQTRVATTLSGDLPRLKAGASLLMALPGPPILYYGEELGMSGAKGPDDNPLRTPMQWTGEGPGHGFTTGVPWYPVNADATTVNVQAQEGDQGSLLSHYRQVARLRTQSQALRLGERTTLPASRGDVAAFLRRSPDQDVVVLANFTSSPQTVTFDLSAVWPQGGWAEATLLLGEGELAPPAQQWTPAELPPRAVWYVELK